MKNLNNYGVLAGRIITGIFYLYGGIHHFTDLSSMTRYAASKGVPLPEIAVILTGILLAVAGISILLGFGIHLSVYLLVIFYIPVTIMMHDFWNVPETEPLMRMNQMIHFMKNFALMGSALIWLAIGKPLPLSLDERIRAGG